LTISDSFGHFIAIMAIPFSAKLSAAYELDQTLTGCTAELLDAIRRADGGGLAARCCAHYSPTGM
jgi:hypothetical protein